MDDWQDAALTNRHLHNRVGKQGRGKGGKSNGAFDVHKTFGTYEVKCPAADKRSAAKEGLNSGVGRLEIYNTNELGNALVGELVLPGALHGTVVFAGSRKAMKVAVRAFEEDEEEEEQEKEEGSGDEGNCEDVEEDDGQSSEEDDREQQRHRQFEKNSFRSPKFWLKWQGEILSEAASSPQDLPQEKEDEVEAMSDQVPVPAAVEDDKVLTTDSGYLVFSGNNCDKFQGTLSCESLGWNNVKLSGWKIKSQPARDFDVQWVS
ncbi:hypothetical protein CKM354_001011800 [Cercospora kikuchii]|uniref:Uncharacterized protein n=1 Tax=Cercospora kikuchii TaxID=84275 RepID=A0A9P3CSZ4_9PEZI|nr:uncharacterized protein CKM354_001011800 [Cercospora kikuchii]GIZ47017.1 hypothetical protein CKM354_001011800 [Cercospora kikuchii]